jgi:hypothetical protein
VPGQAAVARWRSRTWYTVARETVNSSAREARNGQTTGTAVAGPLGPGTFSCPSGQLRFLDAVSYSNTVVTDQFGNTLHATPDPISATLHIQV